MAQKIIDTNISRKYEILFNSFYYFGKRFTTIRRGNFIEWYSYSSYKNEDKLILPYNTSPSGLKGGTTIKEYLDNHAKDYPKGINLEFNMLVWRNNQLEEILD